MFIPRDARRCAIFIPNAQFGQHKVITQSGRALATAVRADYAGLKSRLGHQFGHDFVIRVGAFQEAVATANLAFEGRGHLVFERRLCSTTDTGRGTDARLLLSETFLHSEYRLAVLCGQKSAFIGLLGQRQELITLKACQALVVFLDNDYQIVGMQVFVPSVTTFRRVGWKRRIKAGEVEERQAA